jgi:hypothetical protein
MTVLLLLFKLLMTDSCLRAPSNRVRPAARLRLVASCNCGPYLLTYGPNCLTRHRLEPGNFA